MEEMQQALSATLETSESDRAAAVESGRKLDGAMLALTEAAEKEREINTMMQQARDELREEQRRGERDRTTLGNTNLMLAQAEENLASASKREEEAVRADVAPRR